MSVEKTGGGPNICEAYCGLRNTGLNSGEHFGVELFVRGSFTDWEIRAPFRLSSYVDGVYRAQAQLAVPVPPEPDPHQLKIADAAWTLGYDTSTVTLGAADTLRWCPDGSPDVSFDLQHSGCYNFRVEVADPGSPPAQVELVVHR